MQLRVSADVERLKAGLLRQQQRIGRVSRRVLTAAAYAGLDAVREEMRRNFDRPTPFVLRGAYAVPAREGDALAIPVSARVEWRQFGDNGLTAEKVLRAQVEGGARRQKGFERLIGLPSNRVAVPGKWAPLDQYGNIPGSFIVQVLSDLRLFGQVGFTANRVRRQDVRPGQRRRVRKARFFMIPVGSENRSLWPGVYQYGPGGAPLLVIAFVRAARYRQRIAPRRAVQQAVTRQLPELWRQGLAGTLPFRSASR